MTIYHYRGRRRDGTVTIGTTTTPPVSFVQHAFTSRWRWLELHDGPVDTGELIGCISPHPDTGKRGWWAKDDSAIAMPSPEGPSSGGGIGVADSPTSSAGDRLESVTPPTN